MASSAFSQETKSKLIVNQEHLSAPAYSGAPENIVMSVDSLQEIKSILDLKPSYASKYEIFSFNIYATIKAINKMLTCNRVDCKGDFNIIFTSAKIGSKIFIDEILAKDLKTNKVLYLQPLKIKIKSAAVTK
ncbi:MAG: hypothetical protein ABI388_04630 [Bacteroidia bacterium]